MGSSLFAGFDARQAYSSASSFLGVGSTVSPDLPVLTEKGRPAVGSGLSSCQHLPTRGQLSATGELEVSPTKVRTVHPVGRKVPGKGLSVWVGFWTVSAPQKKTPPAPPCGHPCAQKHCWVQASWCDCRSRSGAARPACPPSLGCPSCRCTARSWRPRWRDRG